MKQITAELRDKDSCGAGGRRAGRQQQQQEEEEKEQEEEEERACERARQDGRAKEAWWQFDGPRVGMELSRGRSIRGKETRDER